MNLVGGEKGCRIDIDILKGGQGWRDVGRARSSERSAIRVFRSEL